MSEPLFALVSTDDADVDPNSAYQSAGAVPSANTTSTLPLVGEWIQRFEQSQNAKGTANSSTTMGNSTTTEAYNSQCGGGCSSIGGSGVAKPRGDALRPVTVAIEPRAAVTKVPSPKQQDVVASPVVVSSPLRICQASAATFAAEQLSPDHTALSLQELKRRKDAKRDEFRRRFPDSVTAEQHQPLGSC